MKIALIDRIIARGAAAGIDISSRESERLEIYLRLLQHWNSRINLTALQLTDFPDESLDKIVVEPIVIKRLISKDVRQWFDLGSGGGSPAIPLKVALPTPMPLVMVESKSRKSAFLREAVRELGLADTTVRTCRAEDLVTSEAEPAQLITVRAVRLDALFLEACESLLEPGGRIALFGSTTPPANLPNRFRRLDATSLPGDNRTVHWFIRE